MAVYDCFTFFNELDVLEIRLRAMSDVVDHFVIVESNVTFRGKPKALFFFENRDRFQEFETKIRHVVVDDMPVDCDAWTRERHQRNSIKRGLEGASGSDLVLVSDVDEIFSVDAVGQMKRQDKFCYAQMRLFVYSLNCEVMGGPDIPWIKAYGAPWDVVRSVGDLTDPREGNAVDYLRRIGATVPADQIVLRGGWHFTWLGDPTRLIEKLDSFSHTEAKVQQWRDEKALKKAIEKRRFFTSGAALEVVHLDDLPPVVGRHLERWVNAGLIAAPSRRGWIARMLPNSSGGDGFSPADLDDLLVLTESLKRRFTAWRKASLLNRLWRRFRSKLRSR